MITAPYNFVPLSPEVVMPFWAKQVSHDIPFQNGVSGVLNLKIKAESPIYVRNGMFYKTDVEKQKDAYKNELYSFNSFNNVPFIPASSIKGMLRSVVEIMGFGRMANKVDDNRYSVRDFNNADYPKETLSKEVCCGWLYKENGQYFLIDCGKPKRISHKTIQHNFNNGMADFFLDKSNLVVRNADTYHAKSAVSKYDKFPFEKEGIFSTFQDKAGRTQCSFDVAEKENSFKGTIVLTGQAGERKFDNTENKWVGKHLEFVFSHSEKEPKEIKDEVLKNFFFAYYNHEKNQQQDDWKWRKKQLDDGELIPVFFRKENEKKDYFDVKDMGLSFLYKIVYNQSIVGSINNIQGNAESYDLAETIFGYAEEDKVSKKVHALKGRVHISHAHLSNGQQSTRRRDEVLAGPKASYYPNYIEQGDNIIRHKTFMNPKAEIKGWKRYPIRNNGDVVANPGTESTSSKFFPLNQGAEFTFQIHYHNLKEEEIGALISAITFHNTEGVYHSIGTAKPLGYGKVSLSIENMEDSKKKQYMKAFESYMNWSLKKVWSKYEQIAELVAMAKGSPNALVDVQLKYMKLSVTPRINEFALEKKAKSALQRFSKIANYQDTVTSLINPSDVELAKAKYDREKAASLSNDREANAKQVKAQCEADFKQQFEAKRQAFLALIASKREEQKKSEEATIVEERLKKRESTNTEGSQIDLNFTGFEYREVADVVKKHLKTYPLLPFIGKQKAQLISALTTSYTSIKKPKNDDWLKKNQKINEFPWSSDIKKWLGEEDTIALHSDLVNRKLY